MTYTEETEAWEGSPNLLKTSCTTPIGEFTILWHKENTNITHYQIKHEQWYIGTRPTLEEAKQFVVQYLEEKCNKLKEFLHEDTHIIHSTDWNGKCFICGKQIFDRK